MKNMISKFFNKECKMDNEECRIDLDLILSLESKGYAPKTFCKYMILNNVMGEIWISEKDDKFLLEFREKNCSIKCKMEFDDIMRNDEKTYKEMMSNITSAEEFKEISKEYAKTFDINNIIDEKLVVKTVILDSKKELLKYLKKNV